jgi:flagellin
LDNCVSAKLSGCGMIGVCYKYTYTETEDGDYGTCEEDTEYDMTPLLEQISECNLGQTDIDIQCGINSDISSRISFNTSLSLNLSITDLTSDSAYNSITDFLNQLSSKATELGAAQNRLESALESNMVQMDNLTSSLSTIRDADISEVSSDFIRQQILQQAAATLMSTANQTPAIALQLI